MRKGALKKKQRQLEELYLDRREALGELVLGMYVQGSWDDDLMARGAAEVREVERELELLAGPAPEGGDQTSGEHTVEHDFPATGEYTAEHDLPATGEYTAEHDLPMTGEHVLRPPSEHTEEHLLPSWREATPSPDPAAVKPAAAKAPQPKPPAEKPAAAKRPEAPTPAPPKPEAKPPAAAEKPPTVAPTPSATAPVVAANGPAAAAPDEKPAQPAVAGGVKAETASAPGRDAATAPSAADGDTLASAPPTPAPAPEDPLTRLDGQLEARQRRARNEIEAARATQKSNSRTELTVISEEVAADQKKLESALQAAAELISGSENRAAAAEAKLARESAAGREAAADWVRNQAAEIEADAALAVELEQEGNESPADPGPADQVLTARIASLEAELASEKAARTEALVTAQARLKEIEANAKAAEGRVAAAEAAAAAATVAGREAEPVSENDPRTEAEAREAAVAWLRGQIAALRKELSSQATPGPDDSATKGDG